MNRIRVTGGKIYTKVNGQFGLAPVGHEMSVNAIPSSWADHVEVIGTDDGKQAITNETSAPPAPKGKKSALQAQYYTITGKDADKRWSVVRLEDEISEASK